MLYIAHRGNQFGPNPAKENQPAYIQSALAWGFDVEIDVRFIDGRWYLGHDEAQYETEFEFINRRNLWVHCKNYEALREFAKYCRAFSSPAHFFYHTDEDYVVTSKQWIWAYPNMPGSEQTICVMPEWKNTPYAEYAGVCSDYVGEMRCG